MSIWASRASIPAYAEAYQPSEQTYEVCLHDAPSFNDTLRLDVLGVAEASCCLTRDAARQLARELLAWADSDAPA